MKVLKNGKEISFSLEIKTINYALGSNCPFVLFYVDVEKEVCYYLPIQDYFIEHPQLFAKIEGEQEKLNVHIPVNNKLGGYYS